MIDTILNPLISRYAHREMTQDALYNYMVLVEAEAVLVDEDELTPDFGEDFTENQTLLYYDNEFWLIPTMSLYMMLSRNLMYFLKDKATAPETMKERALLKSLHLDVLETIFEYEFMAFTKHSSSQPEKKPAPTEEELEELHLCGSRPKWDTQYQALKSYRQAYKCVYGDHWHSGRNHSNLHPTVQRRKQLNTWNRASKTQ